MKKLKNIQDIDIKDKHLLLRLDINTPLKNNVITSDVRIQAALPTIEYAIKQGAYISIASHLGRPNGKISKNFTLEPVAKRLAELLPMDILLADNCISDEVKYLVNTQNKNTLIILENLRFHKGEACNDKNFFRALARPFDVYVNDAFAVCHRNHASIVGVPQLFTERGVGFLIQHEIQSLTYLLQTPNRPYVAILGGTKIKDKLDILQTLIEQIDILCVGGAMAYAFLKAQGHTIGMMEKNIDISSIRWAKKILSLTEERNIKILLPEDHIATKEFSQHAKREFITQINLSPSLYGLDIGSKTIKKFSQAISEAQTIFYNGPMGVFEWEKFSKGTSEIIQAISKSNAYSVIGGGDSISALYQSGEQKKISHISTGGGACLMFLNKGTLPGIDALMN